MKETILSMLREADDYLSGQELCRRLQVSRTAVWKVIGQLKEEGYEIEAVQKKGYCLKKAPDIVTAAELGSLLATKELGRPCLCFEELDSTNRKAKQLAEAGGAHGTLICAEKQTLGKGRRGRSWDSPPGEAVYMSLILRPSIKPANASMLTLVMGLAVAEACNEMLAELPGETVRVQLKWPNDLVVNGRKITGILTEMSTEIDFIHYVVIGVGINVNTRTFSEELTSAGSLYLAAGRTFSRAKLIARCMEAFEKYYEIFLRTEDLSGLREQYGKLLVNAGREVRVLAPGNEYTGTALGIDDRGELLVQRENGQTEAVYAGEVSVRGVYGYV